MIILETKQLILRHQVLSDLDDLWTLYCNPNITKYIPDAPRSRAEAQEELEWHSRKVAEKIGMRFEKEAHDEYGIFCVFSINK
jgi:RimJ/RimL family protein N-acetyltransferase